jgi:hypothetical protein
MTPIAMRSFHQTIVWSTFLETTATMVWMRLPFSTTCRDVVPETSILVPFAGLRQMEVGEISHPCLFAVLRLIRERVAPVSASTLSANVGFPIGFRFRNSGGVGHFADCLRDRVATLEKLPLPEVLLYLCALFGLLLLLLLVPLLLVALLPLVLLECLKLSELHVWIWRRRCGR